MSRKRVLSYSTTVLILVLGVAWFFTLRSQTLGGPVAYVVVSGTSMEPTYYDGDLVLMRRSSDYKEGDIVAFDIPAGQPGYGARIIHRIVGQDEAGYITRGDGADGDDIWRSTPDDIAGRAWLRIPGAGKYLSSLRAPVILATLAAMFAVYAVPTTGKKRPRTVEKHGRPWQEWLRRGVSIAESWRGSPPCRL